MKRRVVLLVAVVALAVASVTTAVAVSLQQDRGWLGGHDGMSAMHDSRQPGGRGPAWMMPVPMHGVRVGSDHAYLAEMVAHHEEAVAAAQLLRRSDRAEMRTFGRSIVAAQSAQIDQMKQWLADWYPNRSGRVEYQPMMRDLTHLSGDRLDRVFLQDMIGHHMGAVMMSQQLLMHGRGQHRQVTVLATRIRDEQHAEIIRMQRWLRDWFGLSWRHAGPHARLHGAGLTGASTGRASG